MKPFDIVKPFIKISKSKLSFEQYIMAPRWDKYDIEVRDDDTIKRSRIYFWLHATNGQSSVCIIYGWKKYFARCKKNINRGSRVQRKLKDWTEKKRTETKKSKVHPSLIKKAILLIRQTKQVKQRLTPPIKFLMQTYHNGVKQ